VRVDGRLRTRAFPLTTTFEEMQAWRRSQRPELVQPNHKLRVHELSDQLKAEILTIAQEAIRDQANGKGPTLKGIRSRLFPTMEPS
jgi:hypothetical protein